MSELLKKALEISDRMEVLSSQIVILKEELGQSLVYYTQGGSFTVSKELVVFVKTLIDLGNTTDTVLIDNNDTPIFIKDLQDFFKNIMDIYFSATNEYYTKYTTIINQKTVESLVSFDE